MRLEKCSDEYFISPVVITVKKDNSAKIALDSKKLNVAIHKKIPNAKHRPPHIRSSNLHFRKEYTKWNILLLKNGLKYAYIQIPLDTQIQKHCNFNKLEEKQQEHTDS